MPGNAASHLLPIVTRGELFIVKLNASIAVLDGVKSRTNRRLTDLYRQVTDARALNGFSRTYQTAREDLPTKPSEGKVVEYTADEWITEASTLYSALIDAAATKDFGNHDPAAVADVVVDGEILVAKAPVSFLLFLAKQLSDVRTVVRSIPELSSEHTGWHYDPTQGLWVSDSTETQSTFKEPRGSIVAPATDKHQAQTVVYHVDLPAGTWTLTQRSGALQHDTKMALLARIDKLIDAVRVARETANSVDVAKIEGMGHRLVSFLFADATASSQNRS